MILNVIKKEKFYLMYIISLLLITIFFSIWIINGEVPILTEKTSITGKYELPLLHIPEGAEVDVYLIAGYIKNCPCKNDSAEFPCCPVLFMRKSENPHLHYEMIPLVEQIYDGTGVRIPPTTIKINSYGFRDYEYSPTKPPNTFRIAVIGDSITFGHGVELNESYPKVLESMLNKRNDGRKYEVLNFGVPGYDLAEKVEVLSSKVVQFNPDMIIFQWSGDDILDSVAFMQIEKEKILEYCKIVNKSINEISPLELSQYRANLRSKYLTELEKNFGVIRGPLEANFSKLNSLTQGRIPVVLISFGSAFQTAWLENISRSYGWLFLDLTSIYGRKELVIDPKNDLHPNRNGHMFIATEIYKKLFSS